MTDTSPEEIMKEFKQYLKKVRLDEMEKTLENKAATLVKQIKIFLGEQNE
jgi:hypothetical protein